MNNSQHIDGGFCDPEHAAIMADHQVTVVRGQDLVLRNERRSFGKGSRASICSSNHRRLMRRLVAAIAPSGASFVTARTTRTVR
mgnify:CR=1 FL=1